ncbi:Ankyrin repeat protein [Taphrina deformans PYCC 5710]|uniref:Ankyrin repeat protein n=1 Tax=Taphrina deformans (strain PYCC 5710 / ATCC 11124 / CBS 356.35 / IMI 108563 / JCM 9778 / NBRC 8474) TaxID=1097556 RepID=R4XBD1_TAPDE|nr:Ankyrin repeat protein [Taphrina deformans PYCC 5710]|eukprot:CCG83159.1 Ankyrin repeat protein [Taphrina deformans PYCC 5710]
MLKAFGRIINLLTTDHSSESCSEQEFMTGANVTRDLQGRPSQQYFETLSELLLLPPELLLKILDFAEIWCSTGETPFLHKGLLSVHNNRQVASETHPLTAQEVHSLRRVTFRVTSKDQGWSTNNIEQHGTYEGSFTWHEAEIVGGDSETGETISKGRFELQRNIHASKDFSDYCIVINQDHDLFSAFSPGCVIKLLACAQFPGWINRVLNATIELQFSDTFS